MNDIHEGDDPEAKRTGLMDKVREVHDCITDHIPQQHKNATNGQFQHGRLFSSEEYFPEDRWDPFIHRKQKECVACVRTTPILLVADANVDEDIGEWFGSLNSYIRNVSLSSTSYWFRAMGEDPTNKCFREVRGRFTRDLLFDSEGSLKCKLGLWNGILMVIVPTLVDKVCISDY